MTGPISSREILARLVAFDTVSARSNLPLVGYVSDFLRAHGIEPVLVPDPTGQKATVFATIGPSDRRGIALSAHTDVVPVEGQAWSTDPFALTEAGGRLYGRGACDMKGFVASVLAAVPGLRRSELTTPVHLVFSYDEEVGCAGVLPTIARMGHDLPRPLLCIVGEPTGMQVVDAHKSILGFDTRVEGRNAHSSMPQLGANAIVGAAALIGELAAIGEELRGRGDPSGRFVPGWTSLGIGTISGGTADNIVPNLCRFHWEFRGLPGFDETEPLARLARFAETEVLPRLRATAPEAAVVTEQRSYVPPLAPDPGSPAEVVALKIARQNRTFAVSYGTEAGQFQRHGIPTVVCGPGFIDQAHAPDEYLEASQLAEADAFMARLVEHCRA